MSAEPPPLPKKEPPPLPAMLGDVKETVGHIATTAKSVAQVMETLGKWFGSSSAPAAAKPATPPIPGAPATPTVPQPAFGAPTSAPFDPSQMMGGAPAWGGGFPQMMPGFDPSQMMGGFPQMMPGFDPSQMMGGFPQMMPGFDPSQTMGGFPQMMPGFDPSQMMGGFPQMMPGFDPSQMMGMGGFDAFGMMGFDPNANM